MCIKLLSCKMSHVTQHYFKMMAFDTKWYVFTPDDHEKKKLLSVSPVTQLVSKWQVSTLNEYEWMKICHFLRHVTQIILKWQVLIQKVPWNTWIIKWTQSTSNEYEKKEENLSIRVQTHHLYIKGSFCIKTSHFEMIWVTWLKMTNFLSFIFI